MYYALCVGALQSIGIHVRHDVVPDFLFTALGIGIVYVAAVSLKLLNLLIGNIEPKFLFCFGKSYPQTAPCSKLFVVREYPLHFLA